MIGRNSKPQEYETILIDNFYYLVLQDKESFVMVQTGHLSQTVWQLSNGWQNDAFFSQTENAKQDGATTPYYLNIW